MMKSIVITTLCIMLFGCSTHMLRTAGSLMSSRQSKNPAGSEVAIDTEYGIASWYNTNTNSGTRTASGRPLQNDALTAAHKEWPMGSKIKVTNLDNGRSEILTITDRGPFIRGRVIDVTMGSAKRLGFYENGLTKTKVELLTRGDWKYQH